MKKILITLGIIVVLVVLFFTVRIFPSANPCGVPHEDTDANYGNSCEISNITGFEYFRQK